MFPHYNIRSEGIFIWGWSEVEQHSMYMEDLVLADSIAFFIVDTYEGQVKIFKKF